jgi:chromosome segregation ATPase
MLDNELVELTAQAAVVAKRLEAVTKSLDRQRADFERRISSEQAEHERLSRELAGIASRIATATGGPRPVLRDDNTYDKAAVLEALRQEGEASAGGIRNTIGAKKSDTDAINKALAALHHEGKARTVEGARGRYKKYVAV